MNKTKQEIKDIEAEGNTVRFINVRKGKAHEPSIVIESGRISAKCLLPQQSQK